MLTSISRELDLRILEVKKMIEALERNSAIREINEVENANKGLMIVNIYSILEYTVVSCVTNTLNIINDEEITFRESADIFKGIAIQNKLQAYSDSGIAKKWDKTWEITEIWDSEQIVEINNSLLPADGSNIKTKQLKSIFKSFGIEINPSNSLDIHTILVAEITEGRNAISHGRTRASEIGRRYTFADLVKKVNEINILLNFIMSSFSYYLENKKYLKN
ncbi:hypothetical protein ACZ11_23795 [Lysinibacillus xylanilyticus]|uniref:MAE-28990/MAE-18760-like HEPN domain-containing protein n=1 Tax=Lysinibacillus xylanilyticus TaxID=582475 RepID=A0A0K9F250_9BACI|nr:MAE_28990/MAE_18760 family HEPN-like nuclease [Lysinibacillus xylanilyticus]KMY28261.1 hypothetical protein ACZ11_23795 [Lysinibacillus xylanilyticus]